jgi:cytochrome c5
MNRPKQPKARIATVLTAGLAVAMVFGWGSTLLSEETKPAPTEEKPAGQSEKGKADLTAKKAKPAPKKLTGAELYSMHCNRCHPERYPTERTAAQWKTIMLHMRVRANLPAEQARTILKYLQENSGR